MSLPDETEKKWKTLLDDGPLKAPPSIDLDMCAKLLANQEKFLHSLEKPNEPSRKNFGKSLRDRYRRIAASRFFKEAYEGKSVGEIIELEE
jgi:hypothetical protein